MITKLTPEQILKFPFYVQKWIQIGISTEPTDFDKSILAAKEIYKLSNIKEPSVFLGPFNNPIEGMLAFDFLSTLVGKSFESSDEINKVVIKHVAKEIKTFPGKRVDLSKYSFGNQEYWLSYYDYFLRECNLEFCNKLKGLMDMSAVCGWWIPLANVCIFIHRPSEIHFDDRNRIYNFDGPAIKFRGSYRECDVYAVHGARVNKKVVEKNFTIADINSESNIEVRRVMIELYGVQKYIVDSKAEVVHIDDFGTLYKKEVTGDETIMMVKVVNSTVEPDGTSKDYFIRVDPNAYDGLKTAHAAVASTWRNRDGSMVFPDPSMYDPDVQS